jgi:hypothetical protein
MKICNFYRTHSYRLSGGDNMNTSSINWADISFQIFWLILLVSIGLFVWKVINVRKPNKHFNKN